MTAFIFDMDGCLLDTIWLWHAAEQRILDSAGITLTKEQRDELNAFTLEEAGAWFHEKFGIMGNGSEVAQAIVDYMLDYYRTKAEANPGAVEFVKAVRELGAPMCVLSSSPQAFIQAGLGHAGIKDLFAPDLVISAEDNGLTKRNTSTFEFVCAKLGTDPADALLFDDSWYALATAQECGLRTVGVYSNDNCGTHEELSRYCEKVVDDFTELDPREFM